MLNAIKAREIAVKFLDGEIFHMPQFMLILSILIIWKPPKGVSQREVSVYRRLPRN